jgi:hypothetical protein
MDLILGDNRNLRSVITKQSAEMEELREQQETLRLLEEETQDENEVLKFKVMSLEALLSMEQGKDLSHLKLLDESNAQKKDLQRQVSTLKRELKALKSIGGEQAEEWDDPKRALEDLRLLYDQN